MRKIFILVTLGLSACEYFQLPPKDGGGDVDVGVGGRHRACPMICELPVGQPQLEYSCRSVDARIEAEIIQTYVNDAPFEKRELRVSGWPGSDEVLSSSVEMEWGELDDALMKFKNEEWSLAVPKGAAFVEPASELKRTVDGVEVSVPMSCERMEKVDCLDTCSTEK